MANESMEQLDREFIDRYPQNPLLQYRSYAYHHVLFMCDGTDTGEELIEQLNKEQFATSVNADLALVSQFAEQTSAGRSSMSDGTEGRVKQTTNGQYVVITNGTINSDYVITSLKWSSLTAANVFPGDQYTSLASDGEFKLVEPRGIKFFNTLAESCKLLGIGAESALFVLKTYFVGYMNDGVRDAVEVIANVKPLMFYMVDIVGTFTEDGGVYDVQFVALANGATRRPHVMRLENFSGQLKSSLRESLGMLQEYINEESASYFSCVQNASRAFSVPPDQAMPPDAEVLLTDKLVKVSYEIFVDDIYSSTTYTVNNSQQAYKERGVCVEPVNLKLGQMSVETAIRTIMESSIQVLLDRKGGESGFDQKFDYRIHSIMKSTSPKNGSAPDVRVMFFITRFEVPTHSIISKLSQLQSSDQSETDESEYDKTKRMIDNNLLAYRYVYTGRNIDILNFDIKMQVGLNFFMILSQTNNIKEHLQTTPSSGVGASIAHQTGTASSVYTPIFLGTNLRAPKGFNSTDPSSSITYNAAMSRNASVEGIETKMTIVGNPILLGNISQMPSDYAYTNVRFVNCITGQQYQPLQQRTDEQQDQTASLRDWGFFPSIARVQVFMPRSTDEVAGRRTAQRTGTSYAEEFWYDGYYYVVGITNIFDDGKFTQELEMMSMPKNLSDASLRDQTSRFNEQLTKCINEKHRIPSPPSTEPAAIQPSKPAPPPDGPYNAPKPDNYTTSQGGWKLGQTSARFESRGDPGAVNPKDANGLPSYGSYQLNGGTLKKYLRSSAYGSKFAGIQPNTAEFSARWKQVGAEDGAGFNKDQHDFIQRTHYEVSRTKLSKNSKLNSLNSRGPAVQDMVWSTSVQYGPDNSVIQRALSRYSKSSIDAMSDCEIVKIVYQYKIDTAESSFKGGWGAKVKKNRFPQERDELLKLCGEKAPTGPKETSQTEQQPPQPSTPTGQPAPANVSVHDTVAAAKGDTKPEGKASCDQLLKQEQTDKENAQKQLEQQATSPVSETRQKNQDEVQKIYDNRLNYTDAQQAQIKEKYAEYKTLSLFQKGLIDNAEQARKDADKAAKSVQAFTDEGIGEDHLAYRQAAKELKDTQKRAKEAEALAKQHTIQAEEKKVLIQQQLKQITGGK